MKGMKKKGRERREMGMVMGRWEGKEGNGMVKKRVWVRGK